MRFLADFSFDQISFWLGFLAASLVWWIFMRSRHHLPGIKKYIQLKLEQARERNRAGVSAYFRQEALRRAQRQHLARGLFPLEEILIPPRLFVPPSYIEPQPENQPEGLAAQIVPYLPDWPEFLSSFHYPSLTPAQVLEHGIRLAIVAPPGGGKSVALADLALHLARKDTHAPSLDRRFPIYLHAHEIQWAVDPKEAFASLVKASARQVPAFVANRVSHFLHEVFTEGRAVLLIDGLDELPSAAAENASRALGQWCLTFPQLFIAVTANPDELDGLVSLEFFPLAVAPWTYEERRTFAMQWQERWISRILPEVNKRLGISGVDPDLLAHWILERTADTPLEWTLKVWAATAGDMIGPGYQNAMDAFILRTAHPKLPRQALARLAYQYFQSESPTLPFNQLESILGKLKIVISANTEDESAPISTAKPAKKKKQKTTRVSSGGVALDQSIQNGLFAEFPGEQIAFIHPVIAGYLAGEAEEQEFEPWVKESSAWPVQQSLLAFQAARDLPLHYISRTLQDPPTPLHIQLLRLARWLKFARPNASWRAPAMRKLLNVLYDDGLPFSIRAKCLCAILQSCDPSLPALLKQLLTAPSAVLRQLAILGAGALGDAVLLSPVLDRYGDQEEGVRIAACLAVSAIGGKMAADTLMETLLHGDDALRQAAAEMLAAAPGGHDILRDAVNSTDLLTRRAAILGLTYVNEEWVKVMLEKIAIEDGQWVVRNAAGQVLEMQRGENHLAPKPLQPPSESPWLITYASQQGQGISPGTQADDLLLHAVGSGSTDEKVRALQYLRTKPSPEVTQAVADLLKTSDPRVREAAAYALWHITSASTHP